MFQIDYFDYLDFIAIQFSNFKNSLKSSGSSRFIMILRYGGYHANYQRAKNICYNMCSQLRF